jgi:hypothetical protein
MGPGAYAADCGQGVKNAKGAKKSKKFGVRPVTVEVFQCSA